MPEVYLSERKLKENYTSLKTSLPNCKLYYACKTNSDLNVIRILNECGSFFDVATNGEIDILNSLGITLNSFNSIHTHPIKSIDSIDYAIQKGINTFVVDNEWEVHKLIGKKCDVLIRISFPNPNVKVDLSSKFGVSIGKFMDLYNTCVDNGVLVRGISFHVGSNCGTSDQHVNAIKQCLPYMQSLCLRTLDIGGGFPCFDGVSIKGNIETFCRPIEEVLEGAPFEIIAEPGRYIVASAMYMYATVIGKSIRGDTIWYYLDTSVYGMCSGILGDHAEYNLEAQPDRVDNVQFKTVFGGCSCDSIDVIAKYDLYPELLIGDKVLIRDIGAYSNATATTFNGIPLPVIEVI